MTKKKSEVILPSKDKKSKKARTTSKTARKSKKSNMNLYSTLAGVPRN